MTGWIGKVLVVCYYYDIQLHLHLPWKYNLCEKKLEKLNITRPSNTYRIIYRSERMLSKQRARTEFKNTLR